MCCRNVADSDMMESLIVELFKPRFLFRKELVGKTTLPLYTLRHSNKVRGQLISACLSSLHHSPLHFLHYNCPALNHIHGHVIKTKPTEQFGGFGGYKRSQVVRNHQLLLIITVY